MRAAPLACAIAAAAMLALGGCGQPRSGAVAETGPCAATIPLATAYATPTAHLVRVRAIKRAELGQALDELLPRRQRPRPHARVRAPAHRLPRKGCLLVYSGSFGNPARRYLVLVISVRHPKVLALVVANRVPAAVSRRT